MRAIIAALMLCLVCPAQARWKPEYAQAAPEVRDWYRDAKLTAAAQKRLGFSSCCAHADVVKTRFRVVGADDAWEYRLQDGTWKEIPPDIIHWGKSGPHGEPVLFALGGVETCFFPGEGGG